MGTKRQGCSRKLTGFLFLVYVLILSWIILLKMELDISVIKDVNIRNVNLIPFAESSIVNGRADVSEIVLNVLAFIPFGIYISMWFGKWNVLKRIVPIFAASLLYEVLQYIFAIGGTDITDLIGNTLGGVIGIGIFTLLSKMLKSHTIKILNILALVGTTLVVGLMGILIVANL